MLPDDLGDLHTVSVNHGLAGNDTIGVFDADSGKTIGGLGAVPKGQPGYMLRANRHHFRQFLFKNINIQFGKSFDHYTEDRDGISVTFKDGTVAHGSILVGADGAHSPVRKQLLGAEGASMVLSPYSVIVQEAILTREQYLPLHKIGSSGILVSKEGMRYLVGMLETYDGGATAQYYTATCYKSGDTEKANAWIKGASKQELYDKVIEITKDLPDMFTDILRIGGADSISDSQIKLEEFVSPEYLPRGRVTLLGDAGHTMVPFRGAGANTALGDAISFAKGLLAELEQSTNPFNTDWFLQTYDKVMLPRGKEMVQSSHAAGDNVLGPLLGRINAMDKKEKEEE